MAKGLVDEPTLVALEHWVPYKGLGLAERLYRSGVLSDAKICEAFVSLGATDGTADLVTGLPPPAALGALSKNVADRHRAIALRVERARLVVAMLDPSDTDAIEKLAFFTGLAVEPRAARARVLFDALKRAYGLPVVVPDAAFLAAHAAHDGEQGTRPAETDRGFHDTPRTNGGDDDTLPAPSPDTEKPVFADKRVSAPAADPYVSPLARSVAIAADGGRWAAIDESGPRTALSLASMSMSMSVRDARPASTPGVRTGANAIVDEKALEELRRTLPPGSPIEARDSLPPQVLRLLVPPLRCALLFLVRAAVAVGWDGRGPVAGRDRIRDVLLPLTAPSAFATAQVERRVVVGDPAEPATIERILWRHVSVDVPSSFAVVPILVGDVTQALLYVDVGAGAIDDAIVDSARRVGNTLADGLAPFVASGTLFAPVKHERLKPIA